MKAEMITLISDDSVFLPARVEFALAKTKLGIAYQALGERRCKVRF
jgi:hypothetical protein